MRYVLVAATAILCSAMAFGQGATGTITGTVTDPSGASVANAPIEISNKANGQVFSAVSTSTGAYTVPQLPVGTYDLKVSLSGFKAYNRTGLSLAAAQVMRIDVPLEVGAVTDSVNVTADASLLNTESAELAHNVTISQLNQLPILAPGGAGGGSVNTSGYRDPFALASLLPAIQYDGNNKMVVNGVPDDTIQIRVEGQTSGGLGGLRQYTAIGQPGADAIQEVAVQTSNYAAEFGAVGGAVFNTTMKSGGNQYHGSAYDYMANEVLNAHQPYTGLRSPTKRNNYGFTIGGPVWIPKLYNGKNKTFFFGSLEEFREDVNTFTNPAPTVPIDAYRLGNFAQVLTGNNGATQNVRLGAADYVDPLGRKIASGTLFDQTTERTVICNTAVINGLTPNCTNGAAVQVRDAFANNLIPVTRFDPVAVKILALVPKPLGPNADKGIAGNNYQSPFLGSTRSYVPSLKLDQTIGSKQRLSGYYGATSQEVQYSGVNGNAEGFPTPITGARGSFVYTYTYRANYDYTITPTLLLHVGAGWYHQNFNDPSPTLDFNPLRDLGLKGATLNRNFPTLNVGSAGQATGGMNSLGPVFGQGSQFERRPSGVANLTWVRANHTYKIGGEWRGERYPFKTYTGTAGIYTFASNSTQQTALQGLQTSQGVTGFPFASFLMGDLSAVQINQPVVYSYGKMQTGLFIQDTWKVTRKLTLDYGLRYDYGQYAREKYGRTASFNPLLPNASAGNHPGGYQYEATCNCQFASSYPYGIGPRIGAAYQVNNKTVIRGGFAVVYSNTSTAAGAVAASATTSVPSFGQTVGKFVDGVPSSLRPVFPDFNASATLNPGAVATQVTYLDPNAGRPARQLQWSFGVQREINKDLVVEASYVANRGVWWVNTTPGVSESALNVMTVQNLAKYGFQVGNQADSVLLNTTIAGLTSAQLATLSSRGVGLPYSNFPSNQTVRQSLLPFPQYANAIVPTQAPLGKTWYDSLQLNVTQRFWHGLSVNANYTYSKNLDLLAPADIYNRQVGKTLSANDLPHQARISLQYQVPNLRKGDGILHNVIVSQILSGWGTGILLQYQSALRLNRPNSGGAFPISNWLGRGPGGVNGQAQIKLDANGNPMNPWAVNWVDYDGKVHPEPLNVNCRCFDPTKTQVLNPAAWVNIPDGQWANDTSAIRTFRGIRMPSEAVNLSRNFRIKEGVNLNIRVEFQNAFNRLRLPQPTVATVFSAAPTVAGGSYTNTATLPLGAYSGGFGTIVPTTGTLGARTGLFIGRLTF